MLPARMEIYDDIGIYEVYEWYNVVVNPTFGPEEFNQDYAEYDF